MACNPHDLLKIVELQEKGFIPKSPKIMELGSNDLNIHEVQDIKDIIHRLGGDPRKFRASSNCTIPARNFYDTLGWEYFCVDIDERPGTINLDLNRGNIEARYKGYFDVVTNHGTTEHVMNPINSFFSVHEMTKKDGLMIHDTPIFGLGNHGFVNLTPKFWHSLIFFNEYKCLEADVRNVPGNSTGIDTANFYLPHFDFIRGLKEQSLHGGIIHIILKKEKEDVFIPPVDLWPDMTDENIVAVLTNAMANFEHSNSLKKGEIEKTIYRFLLRMRPNTKIKVETKSELPKKMIGGSAYKDHDRPKSKAYIKTLIKSFSKKTSWFNQK
jgi:hypothetical protein